ncbi:hypothetical protein TOPH_06065 [Tolypocladium ophioglossoides CBS 100239]|uniref:Uncharacterized protein n=1 Tax=Tolypocladium ophioglossoides (strain CBS 100239) TaxID=1163406 RepID=A0A0L0N5C9_TOLOC|nr:hypothetical protein TOPH_06065 [Tolypocladium ophioglossoides CBS 100239]
MTPREVSRARRVIIARHVADLLPEALRRSVSFDFSVGEVARCWARGVSREQPDAVCAPRNPFHFRQPCMGDSIGSRGGGPETTATLGPCLDVGGGRYWLACFHPFQEAYRSQPAVAVEHPSPYDRARCIDAGHDAMAEAADFHIGHVEVTSGLNLKTTRISHDPYWDDCLADPPLVATDWALIAAGASARGANMLRRFPSETQPPVQERLVRSLSEAGRPGGVVPGAAVLSSGRTSGHQPGQVGEIPAYVSGAANGTGKATREWFVEDPVPSGDGEAWISGGIGVCGDSGGAIVDAESHCLVGQLWARNNYWGSGPRLTYFTPIADIFDDIQEKCGLPTRPQLPQTRDDADRYPVYPSCRQCYDLRVYLDSRRSSRESLQSMIPYTGDADQDQTSVDASELATPHDPDYRRATGLEEVGASFNNIPSPIEARLGPSTPLIAGDVKGQYAQSLEFDDALGPQPSFAGTPLSAKRSRPHHNMWAVEPALGDPPSKRKKTSE